MIKKAITRIWIAAGNRLPRSDDGAVATEYGLLLALIGLVMVAGATAVGLWVSGVFTHVSTTLPTP